MTVDSASVALVCAREALDALLVIGADRNDIEKVAGQRLTGSDVAAVREHLRSWVLRMRSTLPSADGESPAMAPAAIAPEHQPGADPDWCGYLIREAAQALRNYGCGSLAEHVEHLERWHAAGNPDHLYGSDGRSSTIDPAAITAVLRDLDDVNRRARDRKDRTHWDDCWLDHTRCLAERIRRTLNGETP